jgi:hypothetical protein
MRVTRAYIASGGTASVLLGAALVAFGMLSAFVAFGSWPGTKNGQSVDQVLLNDVAKPHAAKQVAVTTQAVAIAKRASARQRVALARANRRARHGGKHLVRLPNGTVVAETPAGTTTAGSGSSGGATTKNSIGLSSPADTVKQPVQTVQNTVQNTTTTVTGQLPQQVQQPVQDVQNQVNQVVGQVGGTVDNTTNQTTTTVNNTVGTTTGTVTGTVGGVLGH